MEFPPYPLRKYPGLIINAAITGMVPTKEMNPYVPISIEEIVSCAENCYKLGASIIHFHARDEKGNPTYCAKTYGEIFTQVRERCPGVIICASCSGRVFRSFAQRSEVLYLTGKAKPDMASLTLGSFNFPRAPSINSPEMIRRLLSSMNENGIKPELEIFEVGMLYYAHRLIKEGLITPPCYFNFVLGSLGALPGRVEDLAYLVRNLPGNSVWAGAGVGVFQLPINTIAIVMGGHVRVGLEDNLWYDYDKKVVATNTMLIERVVRIARELGRRIATPEETRSLLKLSLE